MKSLLLAASLALGLATVAVAEPVEYDLDPSHSQIVFHYSHLGFSTTTGMFSGFNGKIMFDAEKPADSSVAVSFPAKSLFTGWDERTAHFLTEDFFGADKNPDITFKSTSIEVTGEKTGKTKLDQAKKFGTRVVTEAELGVLLAGGTLPPA